VDTGPSCMTPPAESLSSSSWSTSGRPVTRWYWSARRSTCASHTGRPSSEKPAAPASASSPCSVSCSPASPTVIAAWNPTRTTASRSACSNSEPRTAALSTTGEVFGMERIAT
jgi:hypothetical protein